GNRTRDGAARRRRSPLRPVGSGRTKVARPEEEWIPLAVPAIVGEEEFARVQEKLAINQERASRNNTKHDYLLRAMVSCGRCRLSAPARTTWDGYGYDVCNGHHAPELSERCRSRQIPVAQLDALVWDDLSRLLSEPEQIAQALQRAQGGEWLPQEVRARQATARGAVAQIERQQQRLLDASLGGIVELPELERKRRELDQRRASLHAREQLLAATARQRLDLAAIAQSIEQLCARVRAG